MANGQVRIEEMFAFIVLDPADNTEGVAAFLGATGMVPMVGADMKRVESLRPVAQKIADDAGLEITLVKFSTRDELERIAPKGP